MLLIRRWRDCVRITLRGSRTSPDLWKSRFMLDASSMNKSDLFSGLLSCSSMTYSATSSEKAL